MDIYFSSNLKYLRQIHSMSQEELADLVQYSFKNISKWETGQSIPAYETLITITKIFNVEMKDLMEKNLQKVNKTLSYKLNYIDDPKVHNELIRLLFKYLYVDSNNEQAKTLKYSFEELSQYIPKETFYLIKKEKISFNKFCFLIEKYMYELRCNGMIDYFETEQNADENLVLIKYKCL